MLYIIGLGLYDENDITVRGLQAVKKCKRVFLEAYTSILLVEKDKLVGLSSLLWSLNGTRAKLLHSLFFLC